METIILFGKKENFAIEIEPNDDENAKGYLRLWIYGKSVSKFRRKDEYIHTVRNLKKYFTSKGNLYDPIFDNIDEVKFLNIFENWCNLAISNDPKKWDEFERTKKYVRFFAQIDLSMFSFYKNGIITWIVYLPRDKKNPVRIYKLKAEEVERVFNEFIAWYENQFGEVSFNPNVFP